MATAWRQARALRDTGIRQTYALTRFLRHVAAGKVQLSENTVLVIDEISQIAPRPFLRLLELQEKHGFSVKGLGDREQVQAIEAGDTIEILRRVLPKPSLPVLRTTIRQKTKRARDIAGLFREGKAAEALAMKRRDGSAMLLGGDQGQVVDRIAEFYIQRRDLLQASGDRRGITISALTNADAADISQAVRTRLKARGEIGDDEVVHQAIDQRGETYSLPLATGDRVRLFRQTTAIIDGKRGIIGDNGDVVQILGRTERGLRLRDQKGRTGDADWHRLRDPATKRLYLGFGHALTIDSAQGITSGEHINALPRGSAGINAFKAYTAESRHISQVWTMISEAAVHEAVKVSRALGDATPITETDLWDRIATDMSEKPYKSLAIDLLGLLRRDLERTVDLFTRIDHRIQTQQIQGRDHRREIHHRLRAEAARRALSNQITALSEAITRNTETTLGVAQAVVDQLSNLKALFEHHRARIDRGAASAEDELIPSTRGLSPGF
jgi:AAA domain